MIWLPRGRRWALYKRRPLPRPLADRLGMPARLLDLLTAALGSIAANGLAVGLIAFAAHHRQPQEIEVAELTALQWRAGRNTASRRIPVLASSPKQELSSDRPNMPRNSRDEPATRLSDLDPVEWSAVDRTSSTWWRRCAKSVRGKKPPPFASESQQKKSASAQDRARKTG